MNVKDRLADVAALATSMTEEVGVVVPQRLEVVTGRHRLRDHERVERSFADDAMTVLGVDPGLPHGDCSTLVVIKTRPRDQAREIRIVPIVGTNLEDALRAAIDAYADQAKP